MSGPMYVYMYTLTLFISTLAAKGIATAKKRLFSAHRGRKDEKSATPARYIAKPAIAAANCSATSDPRILCVCVRAGEIEDRTY